MTAAARPFSPATDQGEIWQHVKSGGIYIIIGDGLIEADLTPATIYKSLFDGQL